MNCGLKQIINFSPIVCIPPYISGIHSLLIKIFQIDLLYNEVIEVKENDEKNVY